MDTTTETSPSPDQEPISGQSSLTYNTDSIVTEKIREHTKISKTDDAFNYNELANHLLQYILSKQLPISIGVFGKLGSGKSTLLNFLEEAAKHTSKKRIKIIRYDSVLHANGKNPMILSLQKEILKDSWLKRLIDSLSFAGWYLVTIYLVTAWVLLPTKEYLDAQGVQTTKFLANHIWMTLTGMVLGLLLLAICLELAFPFIKRVIDPKEYGKELDGHLINWAFTKRMRKKTLTLVAIENLDRVPPEKSLELLEQLKALMLTDSRLSGEHIGFLVLCDPEVLEKEIHKVYGEEISTSDYLNKLIELSFYLPSYRENASRSFVRKLLVREIPNPMSEKISLIFHDFSIQTPRDIKNYLMDLDMVYVIAKSRGHSESTLLNNIEKILTLLILKSKYRHHYRGMKNASERPPRHLVPERIFPKDDPMNNQIWEILKQVGMIAHNKSEFHFSGGFDMILDIVDSPYKMKTIKDEVDIKVS